MSERPAESGTPGVRVRRLPDRKAFFGPHAVYEVEFTPVGAHSPEWTRRTEKPYDLVSPYLPGSDGYSLILRASRSWQGGVGPWVSPDPPVVQVGGQPVKRRAADYGSPRVRVRRLPDQRSRFRTHQVFEVEFTPYGADSPEWTKQTSRPSEVIQPYITGTDRYVVVSRAAELWTGGVGPWASLYYADEQDGPGDE